ncbi:hypothetical protein V1478_011822 [Vespula squamosa]|uniref:Uncharacterized protein n=1 Tax=Vespula squamosa TaxID=30214 RepID=A0ABD2ABJ2_VESSQ
MPAGGVLLAVASVAGVRAQRGMEDSSRTCLGAADVPFLPRRTPYSTLLGRQFCHVRVISPRRRRLMAATRESLSTWLLLADVTRLPPIYRSFSRVSEHVLRKKEKEKEQEKEEKEEEEEEEEEVLPREDVYEEKTMVRQRRRQRRRHLLVMVVAIGVES